MTNYSNEDIHSVQHATNEIINYLELNTDRIIDDMRNKKFKTFNTFILALITDLDTGIDYNIINKVVNLSYVGAGITTFTLI